MSLRAAVYVGCFLAAGMANAQTLKSNMVFVDSGWAGNSINTAVFRKNSLTSWNEFQFVAFYDSYGSVVLGRRRHGDTEFTLKKTFYSGNIYDAHNSISIIADSYGFLHLSWGQHNTPLQYCRSLEPGSLDLSPAMSMTGQLEDRVTYPEFYRLPNGNLIFLYRDGQSGNGNLVVNNYDKNQRKWERLHGSLINGEGLRNAYWQACVDRKGVIHLSWVWRETPDVASNHDLCYARSRDGGKTWERSDGKKYGLPITAETAEYAWRIPQQQELINQTSMSADDDGNPFIATYWREASSDVPQYHLVYYHKSQWQHLAFNFRKMPFTLSGGGTKKIPIARPQVVVQGSGSETKPTLIFRDAERDNKVSIIRVENLKEKKWAVYDLSTTPFEAWEPTLDVDVWNKQKVLNLFVQNVEQADAEGVVETSSKPIYILEWDPAKTIPKIPKR